MTWFFHDPGEFTQPRRISPPAAVAAAAYAGHGARPEAQWIAAGVFDDTPDAVQPRRYAPPPALVVYGRNAARREAVWVAAGLFDDTPEPTQARRYATTWSGTGFRSRAALWPDEPPPDQVRRRFAPVVAAAAPIVVATFDPAARQPAWSDDDPPALIVRRFAPVVAVSRAPLIPQPVIVIGPRGQRAAIPAGGRTIAISISPRSGVPTK